VLKSFDAQAAQGGPITITHPDITRYFMTIEEASRLTIHAGAIGEEGERAHHPLITHVRVPPLAPDDSINGTVVCTVTQMIELAQSGIEKQASVWGRIYGAQ
jgi:hypothetical protein